MDNHYPGLLVDDKSFYFSLLLQKFVENIRDTYQLVEGNAIASPESPEKLWSLSGKLGRDFAKINDNSKSCQDLWLRVSHVNKMMVYLETNQENGIFQPSLMLIYLGKSVKTTWQDWQDISLKRNC
uniref:Uncharacterized protein n=1 Tax=Ditylenchus dipsaci TaxID=166011 RepID=A0A915DV18_9BILA